MRTAWKIQKSVIYAFFARELKTRFGEYHLGYVWALLEPVAHLLIYLLIFGSIGGRLLPNVDFTLFILTGLQAYFFFNLISSHAAESIKANRALLAYRYVQPVDVIWARVLLETVLFVAVFLTLLLIFALLGHEVLPARPLEVCLAYFLLMIFSIGIGISFGVACAFFPDAKKILSLINRPLYFVSGIFFTVASIPDPYSDWLLWNPILQAVELAREAYFPAYPHAGASWTFLAVSASLSLLFGLALYRVKRFQLLASR